MFWFSLSARQTLSKGGLIQRRKGKGLRFKEGEWGQCPQGMRGTRAGNNGARNMIRNGEGEIEERRCVGEEWVDTEEC